MAVADKLAEMAKYATEVQDVLDKEVELLEFAKRKDAKGAEAVSALTKTGSVVLPHPQSTSDLTTGGWWFCQIVRENGQSFAKPLIKFTPDLYFEAKPIERLWVEKTFEREQKKFTTEEEGDVIEWTPITQEITIAPSGRIELGEFAQYFTTGLAFANVGKAKGENTPLLGIAPTTSKNAFKMDKEAVLVPRLEKVLALKEARGFSAEWNENRKMLLVYLEGVNPNIRL